MAEVDWHALVLTPEWMERIDRLALKRFGQPGLAEEGAAYVLEKLPEDDWAVCRRYSGRARPEHYLLTVINHLFEEFSRKRFGRMRPPLWMQREGELWVGLWKKICLERQPLPAVLDQLSATLEHSREFLANVVTVIKARLPWCGSSEREVAAEEEAEARLVDETGPQQRLLGQHLEESLHLLQQLFLSPDCPSKGDSASPSPVAKVDDEQAARLQALVALQPEEQLLLKMVYLEGMKLKVVARALGMPAYQPGRLLKGIHQRIQRAMLEVGLRPDELAEELGA